MDKRLGIRLIVLQQEVIQALTAKVMQHAGREIHCRRPGHLEGVDDFETAVEPLGRTQPLRLTDQGLVEVHPDQLDLPGKIRKGGQPTDDVTGATADVDNAIRRRNPGLVQCSQQRREKFKDPSPVLKLLGKPLHLAVNPDQQTVDRVGIKHTVVDRHSRHDPRRRPVADRAQSLNHLVPVHRSPAHRLDVEIDDQVRDFQQLGARVQPGSTSTLHHGAPTGKVTAVQIITPALSVHSSERGRL